MADAGRGGRGRRGGRAGRGGRGAAAAAVQPEAGEYRLDIASMGPRHRANALETAVPIAASSHQRMARQWPVVCPFLIDILEVARFELVRHLRLIVHDPQLLTALVERWCPMTNTFHLPVGEITVTLQDVAYLLGVRIDGPALIGPIVVGEGLLWDDWEQCCDELLGTHPDEDIPVVNPDNQDEWVNFKMGHSAAHTLIPLRWLRWTFYRESYADLNIQELHHCVRAYILYMIGVILMPDTSRSHVSLQYLPLLEDLDQFRTFSIGSSILGHLFRELTLATKPSRNNIAGCLHLLQVWSWDRIYVGRPTLFTPMDVNIQGMPLVARWNNIGARQLPPLSLEMYRDQIDRLEQSQVSWTPYTDERGRLFCAQLPAICRDGVEIWTSNVPLISWKRVELIFPCRVMRQFHGVTSMDADHVPQSFERLDGRGRAGADWMVEYQGYIMHWNDRRDYRTPVIAPFGDGTYELMAYLSWYRSWASLYLVQPSPTAPDTYQQSAAEHRLYVDYYHQTSAVARPFHHGSGRNASGLQQGMDTIVELSERLRQQVYIDPTMYPAMGDVGASSSRQPGDDSDSDDDFQDPPPPHGRSYRVRRPPDRHTPGSDAIPRRQRGRR